MPGKYLEYIRAGRYVVPVELSFLPATITEAGSGVDLSTSSDKEVSQDEILQIEGRAVTTTKWVERKHWKEIKAMLKPAVELVAKYNEAGSDKISKSHHLSLGQEISFGYIIHLNKDKSPFLAVLDSKRNFWTDDEDELETDENTDLADYGGRHKNYTPTKCYIKACVIKKSGSVAEDGKKLRKELGIKSDDVRNYFKASNSTQNPSTESNPSGPSMTSHHEKNKSSKSSGKKKGKARNKEGHHHHRKRARESRGDLSSTESLMELPPPISHAWGINDGRNFGDYQSNNQATIIRSTTGDDLISGSSFGLPGSNSCAEKDEEDLDDSDSESERIVEYGKDPTEEAFQSSFFRNWDEEEEEDDESLPELPDIEETNHTVAPKGRRGKKAGGGPRKRATGERSPIKHFNTDNGLPDIDDGNLTRGTRATKGKKKRSVAIVEPMKPIRASSSAQISFEEAIGAYISPTERKKKGRNMSSPTIDRLPGSSRSKTSAIEIISEDSELLPFAESRHQGSSAEKKKKKDGGEKAPRKRRKKKQTESSIYDRLTPSPFPESPEEGEQNEEAQIESDSEPEMPVLVKMVSTSDEEQEQDVESASEDRDQPNVVPPLERVMSIDTSVSQETIQAEPIVQPENIDVQEKQQTSVPTDPCIEETPPTAVTIERTGNSTSPNEIEQDDSVQKRKKKKKLKRRSKTKAPEQEPSQKDSVISQTTLPNGSQQAISTRRARYASDSDDITAESAYRKTPIQVRKKRRKKVIPTVVVPEPAKDLTSGTTAVLENYEPGVSHDPILLSERRNTGDAQTQTILSELVSESATILLEPQIENPVIRALTKTEKAEDSQSYDSDYANGAFSDGDDDDVLFEGQFQANLHLPALGSPEEEARDELDLFSFENPAPVVIPHHSFSLGDGALAPPIPRIDPIREQPTIENDEINYSFDYTVPPASNTVTIDGTYIGASKVIKSFEHSSETDEHDENEMQVAPLSTPGNMSIYQLINHPGTLQAGFGLINQLTTKKINLKEVHKRLGLKDVSRPTERIIDRELMPPPPAKRALSPDICSLNPEKRRRKIKPKKAIMNETNSGGRDSPQPGPSNAICIRQRNDDVTEDNFDEDSEEENLRDGGECLFRELMTRTQDCEDAAARYEPQGDEFDLSQRSHCMLGVVPQYAEKSRRYKMHVKKIQNITIPELKEYFEQIKSDIQGIFDGKVICFRNSLYCSKNHHDKSALRSMNVTYPFEDAQGKALSTYLFNTLLPQPGSRLKYADYINYVMLPESFIRIYSKVNSVCYEMAEKEMRCGGCYDDPMEK